MHRHAGIAVALSPLEVQALGVSDLALQLFFFGFAGVTFQSRLHYRSLMAKLPAPSWLFVELLYMSLD